MLSQVYPLFRQKYLQGAVNVVGIDQDSSSGAGRLLLHMDGPAEQSHHLQRPNLRTLDLRGLQRDDGPPSETQLRRQKFQFFDKHCSEVSDRLFLSGDTVARSRETLQAHGVTHVLNCVGFVCKEYFKDELEYKTYFLQDTPAEDIVCILYDAFEYIDQALQHDGKVLVHCSQGVSRSATVVIAYLMWRTGGSYDDVFAQVKSIRGVANPNIGFTCQLLQWQKRRRSPPAKSRMYRIGPHCQHAPLLLVPRLVTPPKKYETHTWRQLDPRGAFVIQTPSSLYVWAGCQCPQPMVAAAQAFAHLVVKYEATGTHSVQLCQQGSEPDEFVRLMDPPALDADAEMQNARRPSITGELYGSIGPNSSMSLSAKDDMMMDTESRSVASTSEPQHELDARVSSLSEGLGMSDLPSMPSGPLQPRPSSLLARLEVPEAPAQPPRSMNSGEGPSAHPLLSPMLISPALTTPGGLSTSKGQLRLPWSVSPLDEYTPDFQLYADASRAHYSVTPGSEEAMALVTAMAGASRHGDRIRDLRLSVTGTELTSDFMQGGMMQARSEGLLLTPGGPSDSTHGGHTPLSMGGMGSLHLGIGPLGLLGRPDSPAAAEGRLKKYRRGGTSEIAAALAQEKAHRMFPSLHQSMDDEEMP